MCFIHPQIQSWVHKASMCDFNLVAVPMHKSLLQDHRCTHPFRKPSFVPLSLPAEVEEKWRGGGWRATLFAYCCIAIYWHDCCIARQSVQVNTNIIYSRDILFNFFSFYCSGRRAAV